jgi:hypothetical protein
VFGAGNHHRPVRISNTDLEPQTAVTYLGYTRASKVTELHLEQRLKKTKSSAQALRGTFYKHKLSIKHKATLVKCITRAVALYGTEL